ncbi:MAG: hypothetical protein FWC40_07785 [Proteobacteria bacterium]|nr:hypothetical protein [Pseudomonadota bacterium]
MNSSNNHSGSKNVNDLKARLGASKAPGSGFGGGFSARAPKQQQQQIIIEDDGTPGKMFDFDPTQMDASLVAPKDNRKTAMVGFVILIALIFGGVVGYLWQGVLSARSDVNTRIEVAKRVEATLQPKVDAFQTFAQIFKQRSESLGAGVLEYNDQFFNQVIRRYRDNNFVLDISSDLPPDTVVLATNALQNPLADIRSFAAGTTTFSKILDSHIAQTELDMEEIKALLGQSSATDRNIVYALRVDPLAIMNMVGEAGTRQMEALTVTRVYQVKRAITDDDEAARVFAEMRSKGLLAEAQIRARTFSPAAAAARGRVATARPASDVPEGLVLPNRLMYVIQDRSGKEEVVFADEIILIDRAKLYATSPNALERYRKRMIQILALLGDIEKTTDGLMSKLHAISTEEPL